MQRFFQSHGVKYFCHQISNKLKILARKWGIRGKEIHSLPKEKHLKKIQSQPARKSISHSKVLPSQTYSADLILAVIQTLCEKVAYRLRENHMITQKITLLLKTSIGLYKVSRSVPYNENTASFFNLAKEFRPLIGQVVIRHVHVCATNLLPNHQLLFYYLIVQI